MASTSNKRKVLLKIIILGDSGVGKTAFLQKYINDMFIQEHKATIGADFMTKDLMIEDKMVTLQIWDTAGQERFQSLGVAFYRGADACVLVYDTTNIQSFEHLDQWRREFITQASPEDEANFPFLVIGNKTDLADSRQVPETKGRKWCEENGGIQFAETSAKTGAGVEGAMQRIAAAASAQPTAPFFNEIVAETIQLDEDDVVAEEPKAAGCAC